MAGREISQKIKKRKQEQKSPKANTPSIRDAAGFSHVRDNVKPTILAVLYCIVIIAILARS
jgi:hypothetical protein